jgi:spermidine/putrescine transport system substrate-binding protein
MKIKTLLAPLVALALLAAVGGAQAQDEEKKLNFYNWSNYFPPDLLKVFTEQTGIEVTHDQYSDNEALLAKLQAGSAGYDVVVPSDYMVDIMTKEGLLLALDKSLIPNTANILPPHDNPWYDKGRAYSAPYMWGTTGLTYDSERVPDGKLEESWKEFFEPRPELEGKIAALDDMVELYNAAAFYLGVDQCTEDPAVAQKILDVLQAQKPKLALYSSDGTIERMIAGEVIMHHQWNGASTRTTAERPTAVYMYPKEGVSFWADNLVVPKDAPHPKNAMIFINWLLDPKNIAEASNFTGYMNSVKGAEEFMKEELRNSAAVNMPAEFADRLRPSQNCSVAARELRDKVWTTLKK